MITTQTLTRQTGLSAKTLTRWANRGIIAKPAITTHPSGRGKVGYWPDAVLDRCLRIVHLRQEGHSIESAVAMLGVEHIEKCLSSALDQPSFADLMAKHKVKGARAAIEADITDAARVIRAYLASRPDAAAAS